MEKQNLLVFGVIAILVIGILLIGGRNRERGPTETPSPTQPGPVPDQPDSGPDQPGPGTNQSTSTPQIAGLETCTELNGYVCGIGEDCLGVWLDASDTFSCCSKNCKSAIEEGDILSIDPFETTPENEDLGDII